MSKPRSSRGGAFLVAAGIFLSRIAGLIRTRVFAHYLGNSAAADAFNAALKIPNFLQNLFGEGVLSASFIPVYSALLGKGDKETAARIASVIASLLGLVTSILVTIGIMVTPYLIDLIAPGFQGPTRELTIQLVRIFFPGVGLLVMSAWCLGILNSHGRFFLSYVAPVVWNAAQIAALIIFGRSHDQNSLAIKVAWGLVAGSALQFGLQLPFALSLVKGLRPSLSLEIPGVRTVINNFLPVVFARGVIQFSAYIDNMLASWLPTGAVSTLSYAQLLYLLPVSLFGMSVSAAELPAMSSTVGTAEEVAKILHKRLSDGLKRIAFYVIPSAMGFMLLGDVIVATIFQTGKFSRQDTVAVWLVLIGSSLGLLSATMARLYSSTFYALQDTRTPLRFAIARVIINTMLGVMLAFATPRLLNIDLRWGTMGITIASSIASWIEFSLLRDGLNKKIGRTGLPLSYAGKLWLAAIVGAAVGWGVKLLIAKLIGSLRPFLVGPLVLAPYGLTYFAITWLFGIEEIRTRLKPIERRLFPKK